MKVTFSWLGKSKDKSYDLIIDKYVKKIKHYTSADVAVLKEPKAKGLSPEEQKKKEAELILSKIEDHQLLVLLDERGKRLSSRDLAKWIEHKQNISISQVVFLIAGAYGAHPSLKERADFTLSLSDMTLTHDMARMIILEQVYRAYTILRGEKYHND